MQSHRVSCRIRIRELWAKGWEEVVGEGMTLGFLNLGKVRDERENE